MPAFLALNGKLFGSSFWCFDGALTFSRCSLAFSILAFRSDLGLCLLNIVEVCFQLFQIIFIVLNELGVTIEDLFRELCVFELLLRGAEFLFELNIR